MDTLDQLIQFSRLYGADTALVCAGGGNTSAKDRDGGIMYVKCSGTALKDASVASFVKINLNKLQRVFSRDYPANEKEREAAVLADLTASRCPGEEGKRPSVETLLHALFPQKFVLHLHPALINGLTCSVGGKDLASQIFGEGIVWIPACRPGYILAKLMYDKMNSEKGEINTVLLQNHGVFFAADTVCELDAMLENMLSKLRGHVREWVSTGGGTPEPGFGDMLCMLSGREVYRFNGSDTVRKYAWSEKDAKVLMRPFTPDQVVYCGPDAQYIKDASVACKIKSKVIIVKDAGIYTFGDTESEANNAMLLFLDAVKIATYSLSFGGPCHMPDTLVDFLMDWEAESYRKSL